MNQFQFGFRGDATDAMNAALYGNRIHSNVAKFIQQQRQAPLPTGISQAAATFITHAKEAAGKFMGEERIEFARKVAVMDGGDTTVGESTIQELDNIISIQRAGRTMVPFVMADPVVRDLYHRGRAEGYNGFYEDRQPTVSKDGHYEYMLATDGMVTEEGDVVEHFFDIKTGDRPLTVGEQVAIANTWDCLHELLDMGQQDPTSPLGELL